MRKYPIVAILWEDHTYVTRSSMVKSPDAFLVPTMTVGILYKETDKAIIIVSDIEKYESYDEATYYIILKNAIISKKEFGRIKLTKLRTS